jgi:hypothetical protein
MARAQAIAWAMQASVLPGVGWLLQSTVQHVQPAAKHSSACAASWRNPLAVGLALGVVTDYGVYCHAV